MTGRRAFALLALLRNFLIFFLTISFVVTCTFLVFFSSVPLAAEQVRAFAPFVFINMLVLSALFVVADAIRRYYMIERPVKEIGRVLEQFSKGHYDARVTDRYVTERKNFFESIAEDINRLGEELSGVETLRTDFIANVSHEMKTPLAVIQTYGTMLKDEALPSETRREYAQTVTDAARRLSEMTTNMLKLNRLENQRIYPKGEKFDLGEQLCECLLAFETVWEKKEIEIETDIADGVHVHADRELLSLVWNNLLSNAFKFTPEGGRVSVSLTVSEQQACVSVHDTGCGISPEVGAHMFEKFYQGDTSHSAEGNGLGLALVKRVVDITHAEIHVTSAPGDGSTFTVKLRRDEA